MQELATNLLRIQFEDPEKWAHMEPYRASLPGRDQIYNKYIFQLEHLPLLQDPGMVSVVSSHK